MSKFSKALRSTIVVKALIYIKFILVKGVIFLFTIGYLKFFKKYRNFKIIKDVNARGAAFYVKALKGDRKVFIKVANRKNSSRKSFAAYKSYHQDNDHCIKLIDNKYAFIINYDSFYYVEFETLVGHEYVHDKNRNLTKQLINIALKLKKSRVNHRDIIYSNIAVIINDSSSDYVLELFDFGTSEVDSDNFDQLFKKDIDAISNIAREFLDQKLYDDFCNELKKLL